MSSIAELERAPALSHAEAPARFAPGSPKAPRITRISSFIAFRLLWEHHAQSYVRSSLEAGTWN